MRIRRSVPLQLLDPADPPVVASPPTMGPELTRRSLLQSALAAGGLVGTGAVSPHTSIAREIQPRDASRVGSPTSISRQFARWVAGLRYEDLPSEVVDRAKGLTLHALASALLGSQLPGGREASQLIAQEEAGVPNGATIMVAGTKATKAGAAFANSEMMWAGRKLDTFRMLTHPGTCILPSAFAAAETERSSGRDFVTAVVAGYEVMERMAADFIPTVMARGFHAGPVFGIFGAAVAAAKIMRFTEDQLTNTIALWREPGGRQSRKPRPARECRSAQRHAGGPRWRSRGAARARPPSRATPASITPTRATTGVSSRIASSATLRPAWRHSPPRLGEEWLLLETLYRIYSTSGYNIAHVDVTAQLCEEQNITYEDVDRVRGRGELAGDAVPESCPFPPGGKTWARPPRAAPGTTPRTGS